jgi:hypothetical protein
MRAGGGVGRRGGERCILAGDLYLSFFPFRRRWGRRAEFNTAETAWRLQGNTMEFQI